MTLPRWDEEMKFELLRLKSELRPENFRVLHAPIGLGRITKIDEAAAQPISYARAVKSAETHVAAIPPLPLPAAKHNSSMSRSLARLLIIHSLDVAFVVMTLGLGLLFASWLIDPGHMALSPELLKRAAPIRFLLESKGLTILLGLYGFFSLYWLFFKLVSGSTLGESFLDNFRGLQNPRRVPSIKDSGDS